MDQENKETTQEAPVSTSFSSVLKILFKKTFKINGREPKEAVLIYLYFLLASFLFTLFCVHLFPILTVLFCILFLLLLAPLPSLIIRRFHDHEKNAGFAFVPFVLFLLLIPSIRFDRLSQNILSETPSLEHKWLTGGFFPELIFVLFVIYSLIWVFFFFSKGKTQENMYGEPVFYTHKVLTSSLIKKFALFVTTLCVCFSLFMFKGTEKNSSLKTELYNPFSIHKKQDVNKKHLSKEKKQSQNNAKPYLKKGIQPHPLFPELPPHKYKESSQMEAKRSLLNPIRIQEKEANAMRNNEISALQENNFLPHKINPLSQEKTLIPPFDLNEKKQMISDLKEVILLEKVNQSLRFLLNKSLESTRLNTPLIAQEGDTNPSGILFLKAQPNGNVFFVLTDENLYPHLAQKTVFCENDICIFNPEEFLNSTE